VRPLHKNSASTFEYYNKALKYCESEILDGVIWSIRVQHPPWTTYLIAPF